MPIHVTPVLPTTPSDDSYLSVPDADALAATMPGLASYSAASSLVKLNALIEATHRIDVAMPYQGVKFSLDQVLEFPRRGPSASTIGPSYQQPYPMSSVIPEEIMDWDSDTQTAVVPAKVLRACLLEANSILAGLRDDRMDALHDGIASQSIGSASEAYFQGTGPKPVLCRAAHQLMIKYSARSGPLS